MGIADWLRVVDMVSSGVAQASRRLRQTPAAPSSAEPGATGALGQVETRLTGVLVAALREAFDRDRARLDLEREQIDADRRRAEAALRLEAERQAIEREVAQARLTIVLGVAIWITSAVLAAWLPGMRTAVARILLGSGWLLLIGALGFAFTGARRAGASQAATPAALAQGFLIGGLVLCAGSLIAAMGH